VTYDDCASRWTVETDGDDRLSAAFYIMVTGALSAAHIPDIPGLESCR